MNKAAKITGADVDRLNALFESDRIKFHKEAARLLGGQNPTGAPPPEDLKLYRAAGSFYRSAQAIKNGTRVDDTLVFDVAPHAVCFAFSCELLLKCLLLIEKGPSLKLHDLRKLFNALTEVSRETITRSYVERIDESDVDMRQHLKSVANTFKNVRYLHERDQHTIHLGRLYALTAAVAERIKESGPTWLK